MRSAWRRGAARIRAAAPCAAESKAFFRSVLLRPPLAARAKGRREKEQSPVRMGERTTNILTGQEWHCLAGARSRRPRRKAARGRRMASPRFDAGDDTIELLEKTVLSPRFPCACMRRIGRGRGRHATPLSRPLTRCGCVCLGESRAWWLLTGRPTDRRRSIIPWKVGPGQILQKRTVDGRQITHG
jgi:hypothetical protein